MRKAAIASSRTFFHEEVPSIESSCFPESASLKRRRGLVRRNRV